MIKKLLISSGAVVATVALSSSMAFASSISTTGPHSKNKVVNNSTVVCTSTNKNKTSVNNYTTQSSLTGNAKVKGNTGGGDATTGGSTNGNTLGLTVHATNTSPCSLPVVSGVNNSSDDSIDTTGPHSFNLISNMSTSITSVSQSNELWVGNVTVQGSQSGDATVSGNTSSGDATSGDSGNTNGFTLNVTSVNQ